MRKRHKFNKNWNIEDNFSAMYLITWSLNFG